MSSNKDNEKSEISRSMTNTEYSELTNLHSSYNSYNTTESMKKILVAELSKEHKDLITATIEKITLEINSNYTNDEKEQHINTYHNILSLAFSNMDPKDRKESLQQYQQQHVEFINKFNKIIPENLKLPDIIEELINPIIIEDDAHKVYQDFTIDNDDELILEDVDFEEIDKNIDTLKWRQNNNTVNNSSDNSEQSSIIKDYDQLSDTSSYKTSPSMKNILKENKTNSSIHASDGMKNKLKNYKQGFINDIDSLEHDEQQSINYKK